MPQSLTDDQATASRERDTEHQQLHGIQETIKVKQQTKKEGKDQQSLQSSTTPDQGYQYESENCRHHKREPRVRPFQAGNHKALMNRRAQFLSITKTRQK